MMGAANNVKFLVGGIIMAGKPPEKIRDNRRVLVSKEEVVDMPTYGQLFSIDDLVGNTRVIWVNLEINRDEVSNEFSIKL
jgi:hypothetical protein